MEKQNFGLLYKFIIILCILGICAITYFMVIFPYLNRGEGDPYFIFYEIPVNSTVNNSIIHIEDKDILNIKGLDVEQRNGKIFRIYFRKSLNPSINDNNFYYKFGSRPGDLSSRKYLEYHGVYYYAVEIIP